jgi:hypothetical protein
VRLVGTMNTIAGLPLLTSFPDGFRLYRVEGAAERAKLYGFRQMDFVDASTLHARLRDPATDLDARLMLDLDYRARLPVTESPAARPARIEYRRLSSDLIAVAVDAAEPGYLRLLESWDPGWQATVDGQTARVLPGNDVFLSVAVPAGRHLVTFAFSTPGLETGIMVSVASLCLLVMLLIAIRRATATSS